MEDFAQVQGALNHYNQLHPRFTVFVEHLQEHPDFQLPAVVWGKQEQNLVEFYFLNFHLRLHFEIIKLKGKLLGRITIEKTQRGSEYKDLGLAVFLDAEGRAWLGQVGKLELSMEDDMETIAAYLFAPLLPVEGGAGGL